MKLYNSLSKSLEEFVPHKPKEVKIYVCGITPYDTTHMGHAFTYLFFDTLVRFLRYKEYKVTYTQNVTDINDRDNDILKRALEQGKSWKDLARFWTDKFLTDMNTLNWVKPDNYLWASENIPIMTKLIEQLLENKVAYKVNGGVYLDIKQVKNFGKLSGFSEQKMLSVAHDFDEDIDNPDKKNPLDITLWRGTMNNQPSHIPSFESSIGSGRPGWHLECSAMAIDTLGKQIDIHGGGIDLLYPHHESEIAQSEGATGLIPFSKYWLHTQLVAYKGHKISKSRGNLIMVSELLNKYSPNVIKFLLLSHHYRTAWEYHEEELMDANKKVEAIENALQSNYSKPNNNDNNLIMEQFNNCLENDMNTPSALNIIMQSVEEGKNEEVKQMTDILGFKF